MQCPRCKVPTGDFETGEGLNLDLCPQCKAVWFDAGELARMFNTTEDLPTLEQAMGLSEASALECPRCAGTPLVRLPYAPGQRARVETCPTCQGTLVALSDLNALRTLAEGMLRPSRAHAHPHAPSGVLAHASSGDLAAVAKRFNGLERLSVKQRRRWVEMLTGFETPNEYNVIGNGMGSAFLVQEQTAGLVELLKRMFLGPARPFVSYVEDMRRGSVALKLMRPFRWFHPELEVRDADENLLARIVKRWTWIHPRYDIFDASGGVMGEIHGSVIKRWTFEIKSMDKVVARVIKQWSGLGTEMFSDADNFEVTFEPDAPALWKPLALAAAVLIDVVHFERSNK